MTFGRVAGANAVSYLNELESGDASVSGPATPPASRAAEAADSQGSAIPAVPESEAASKAAEAAGSRR